MGIVSTTVYKTEPIFTGLSHGKLSLFSTLHTSALNSSKNYEVSIASIVEKMDYNVTVLVFCFSSWQHQYLWLRWAMWNMCSSVSPCRRYSSAHGWIHCSRHVKPMRRLAPLMMMMNPNALMDHTFTRLVAGLTFDFIWLAPGRCGRKFSISTIKSLI